jgi:hypothetical protein
MIHIPVYRDSLGGHGEFKIQYSWIIYTNVKSWGSLALTIYDQMKTA